MPLHLGDTIEVTILQDNYYLTPRNFLGENLVKCSLKFPVFSIKISKNPIKKRLFPTFTIVTLGQSSVRAIFQGWMANLGSFSIFIVPSHCPENLAQPTARGGASGGAGGAAAPPGFPTAPPQGGQLENYLSLFLSRKTILRLWCEYFSNLISLPLFKWNSVSPNLIHTWLLAGPVLEASLKCAALGELTFCSPLPTHSQIFVVKQVNKIECAK